MKDRSHKKQLKRIRFQSVIIIIFFLFSCSSNMKPVELHPEDMCDFCKMAISEKQFAAEIITDNGNVSKFDDIGCMLNYIESRKLQNKIAASYVMDFEKRHWIAAEQANYVATTEIQTPMRGGLLAFQNQEATQSAVSRFKGRLLTYSQLMRESRP